VFNLFNTQNAVDNSKEGVLLARLWRGDELLISRRCAPAPSGKKINKERGEAAQFLAGALRARFSEGRHPEKILRSSEGDSTQPVARPAAVMCDGQNLNFAVLFPVDDGQRKGA
jgi:hypothetical protein